MATYGVPGGKRERCAAHAGENMVDIFNRKCVIEGCHLRATFGVEGGKRERCAKHTDDWMVNFNRRRYSFPMTVLHNEKIYLWVCSKLSRG